MRAGALLGEYRVLERLGAGGMGEVFRAVHTRLGRVVALKVLALDSPVARERFQNEARIHAALRHAHIATLFEFIEVEGRCCLVMEYVEGAMLSELIANSALPLERALVAFGEIVEAVAYLHRHGVVHRDIKASNVKMGAAGQVKLLDFGIAQSRLTPRLTQVGSVIGTLEYLSPEQLRGENATPRADVWSLGILLYEMTTGQLPFQAPNLMALHEAIQHAPRVRPTQLNPQVPRAVEEIVARCLHKNPAQRYADAEELLRAVRNASRKGEENPQRKLPALHRPDSSTFKANLPIVVGVTALLLCGILTMLLQRPSVQQEPETVLTTVSTAVPTTVPAVARAENRVAERARENQSVNNRVTHNQAVPDELQTVKIDATGGPATVFRDGREVGTTPYVLRENLGEKVALTLQREGYRAREVEITVNERKKTYSFLLEK